jgi:hypothetical protein
MPYHTSVQWQWYWVNCTYPTWTCFRANQYGTYRTVFMRKDSTFLRSCVVPDDVKNARDSSSVSQPKSWLTRSQDGKVPGPPSTSTKLAFTCKFVLTNKQKPTVFNPQIKGTCTCLSFSLIPKLANNELRNTDDLYVPAHKIGFVKRYPFSFRTTSRMISLYWNLFQIEICVWNL